MGVKNANHHPNGNHHHTMQNGKFVGVSTKDNFRRPVPKTYSYRYEVTGDAGPAGEPLVRAGAAIIESRYRGRGATWNVARSVTEPQTYLVRGGYVHPLEDNPMAYPPRSVISPEAAAHPRPPPRLPRPHGRQARPAARGGRASGRDSGRDDPLRLAAAGRDPPAR